MTIHEFDYFHQDRAVNPKHVESLVRFYEYGCVPCEEYMFGVEIEHLPVRVGTNQAVTFAEPRGIRELIIALSAHYDADKEYREDGQLLGLGKEGIAVSLEPGGQVECSLGPMTSLDQLQVLYAQFRRDIDPLLERFGIRLINFGYQPITHIDEIKINPKPRYRAMNAFFGRYGRLGRNMMRGSASTQVSFDFSSEHDEIAKMRVACAVGPILAYVFRNSPFFEGQENPYPLLRQHMWDNLDPNRTGLNPGIYDDNFGFEQAAYDVLATPLMVADLSHTPEYTGSEPVYMAAYENAAETYPDRELNTAEIMHITSTHFTDVRLKNFIEMRHWDSLPIGRVEQLTDTVLRLFTDETEFSRLSSYFDGLRAIDVVEAKANLQARGAQAAPYGQSLDFWTEFLHVEGAEDSDEPGDPLRPEVFQR